MRTRTVVLAVVVLTALVVALAPAAAVESPGPLGAAETDSPALPVGAEEPAQTPVVSVDPSTAHGDSPGGQTDSEGSAPVEACATDQPEDFADPEGGTADVIGWVDGYWYDEPLDIDVTDGLSESELEALSARTAARFEAMRCLTVQDGLPPVDIVPREEFAEQQRQQFDAVGETERLVENAKFETLLAIDSETDAIDVRADDSAARVGGFYDFIANEIVVVTDDPDALSIDEGVLAHELGHAIQDQQFDLARFDRSTTDLDAGKLGLIEGDVDGVEHEYLQACEAGAWAEPCETDDGAAGSPDIANWALYFEGIHPYSDGPSFIDGIRQEGGWQAVDELYNDPPTSALHITYPETFGEVEPRELDVSDTSTEEWERIELGEVPTADEPLTHDTLGISAIMGMFAAPAHEAGTTGQIINELATFNTDEDGFVDSFNPHNYAHPETEGWRGDELYTYTNGDGDSATVWELAWASAADAEPFVEGYEELIDIRGGERVEGHGNTYTFEDGTGFDMAVTMVQDDDRVTIVTAPTVDDLTAVDQRIELQDEEGDPSSGGDSGTGDAGDGTGDAGDGTGDAPDGDGLGPGLIVLSILGGALLLALVALITAQPGAR